MADVFKLTDDVKCQPLFYAHHFPWALEFATLKILLRKDFSFITMFYYGKFVLIKILLL